MSVFMLRLLITGAGGQLGESFKEIAKHFPEYEYFFASEEELDITDNKKVYKFLREHQIKTIINCAAYTAVDKAESEPLAAEKVNYEAVKLLAEAADRLDISLIHFSTDYVFSGDKGSPYTEDDVTEPFSVYGKTKLMGEKAIIESGADAVILRTSWLYSSFGHNFVKTMLRLGREKEEINVVNDQYGCPTYAPDLAEAVMHIIPGMKKGNGVTIYHYCNKGATNWFGFASEIMKAAGYKCVVNPVSTSEFPTAAKRPAYSVLSTEKIIKETGIQIPDFEISLRKCINIILNLKP